MAYGGYVLDESGGRHYFHPRASLGSFDNTSRSRIRTRPAPPLASAAGHRDERTLEAAIRDGRDAQRNSDVVGAIINGAISTVVGDEVTLKVTTDDEAWNREVEERWAAWSCRCDLTAQLTFTELLAAVVSDHFAAGGLLVNKYQATANHQGRLQAIEVDRLRNPRGTRDDKTHHAGVQTDELGGVLGYHVAEWGRSKTHLETATTFVPAGHAWLVNDCYMPQAGLYRAEPRLTRVLERLEELLIARRSTLAAYELATLIGLFFAREDPDGSIGQKFARAMVNAGGAADVSQAQDRGQYQAAAILEGRPNERVTQIKPEFPTTQFDLYLWTELHIICASVGLPLEIAMFRFIRNFSASKAAVSIAHRTVKRQRARLRDRLMSPVYEWWLHQEIAHGRIADPDPHARDRSRAYMRHRWRFAPMPSMDLDAEVEAHLKMLAGGLITHGAALDAVGQGPRDRYLTERTAELAEERELGLEIGKKPTQPTESRTVEDPEHDPEQDGETADELNGRRFANA
jgi:capsid protein